jgi:hypothetical protein
MKTEAEISSEIFVTILDTEDYDISCLRNVTDRDGRFLQKVDNDLTP